MSHLRKKRNDVSSAMLGVSPEANCCVEWRNQYLHISQEADLVPLHHQRNLADSSNFMAQLVSFSHIYSSPQILDKMFLLLSAHIQPQIINLLVLHPAYSE